MSEREAWAAWREERIRRGVREALRRRAEEEVQELARLAHRAGYRAALEDAAAYLERWAHEWRYNPAALPKSAALLEDAAKAIRGLAEKEENGGA